MSQRDYSADFFDFAGAVYLNCAFHGAMPRVAIEAVEEALQLKKTPHLIRDEHHFSLPEAYRDAAAELIGAAAADVAVTNSATQGTMILVAGLDWAAGDEVVLPSGEFPSNLFPWRSLETRGVIVQEIDLSSGAAALERIEAALSERTRVVSLSWVHYSTGLKLDIEAIGRLCRERGVLFAIDASQGLGGLPFRVDDLPCDLLTSAGYKWLLGPYGVGFAWVRPGLAERLAVSNINWFSLEGARDFNRLSECELAYGPGARRFDMNEPASFFNMAGAAASMRYLLDVGPAAVQEHVEALQRRLVDNLPPGLHSLADPDPRYRSNILCVATASEQDTAAAFDRLTAARVHVSRREGAIRISPHLYNGPTDIDRLLERLHARS